MGLYFPFWGTCADIEIAFLTIPTAFLPMAPLHTAPSQAVGLLQVL